MVKLFFLDFDFLVSCVNKDSINETAQILADRGIAVLTETPVSTDTLKGKIQVAEQFHFMPRNQAYKKIIDSGILGEVHQVQLSCCHDYHAASLIRFFLDIKAETPTKTTISLPDKLTRYNCRNGHIEPTLVDSEHKITVLLIYIFHIFLFVSSIAGIIFSYKIKPLLHLPRDSS